MPSLPERRAAVGDGGPATAFPVTDPVVAAFHAETVAAQIRLHQIRRAMSGLHTAYVTQSARKPALEGVTDDRSQRWQAAAEQAASRLLDGSRAAFLKELQ